MNPQELCLDANIFVAAIDPDEEFHNVCLDLIDKVEKKGIDLFEPAIAIFEVVSIFHRKAFLGDLTKDQSKNAAAYFLDFPLMLQWQPFLLKRAAAIASELKWKKVFDCNYVAVAEWRDIPFVTLDDQLLQKGRSIFKQIFHPQTFLETLAS